MFGPPSDGSTTPSWRPDRDGQRSLSGILRRLDSSTAVTVSDIDRFCDAGGIIAFVARNNQIRFEVNVEAAQKRNLKISSKLLSLALIHKSGD